MRKLGVLVLYLLLSLAAAGLFGMIHDQISYTVSDEYFTRFKFIQFGLAFSDLPDRARVAIVGFLASWWMGFPLGLLTGLAGWRQPTAGRMLRALLVSLPLIIGFVLLAALSGLAYGYLRTARYELAAYQALGWFIPPSLVHPRNFLCAGYMHNAAYLGGALAIPFAWLLQARFKTRTEPVARD